MFDRLRAETGARPGSRPFDAVGRNGYSLWFEHQAEEAAHFYTSVFRNSKIVNITRYGKAGYEVIADLKRAYAG